MATKNIVKNIMKSNNLILSHFKMTLHEQKIIVLCISKIKRDAKKDEYLDLTFNLTVEEISKFLFLKKRTLYKDLDDISNKLMSYIIEIRNENNKFEKIRPFPYSKYENGTFILRFEQSMRDYLMELKNKFTTYDMENVRYLKSNYSMRLYEILKSYEWTSQCNIELEELKKMIGIIGSINNDYMDLYTKYNDFKRYVLIISQKELSEKTDIRFDFEEIKTGRKITHIKFIINENNIDITNKNTVENQNLNQIKDKEILNNKKVNIDDLLDSVISIISEPLRIKDLRAILEASNNDIQIIRDKYQIAKEQGNIANLTAWIIKAIKEDYNLPVKVNKKNKFINYEQREWDFDKFERLEREYIDRKLQENSIKSNDLQNFYKNSSYKIN